MKTKNPKFPWTLREGSSGVLAAVCPQRKEGRSCLLRAVCPHRVELRSTFPVTFGCREAVDSCLSRSTSYLKIHGRPSPEPNRSAVSIWRRAKANFTKALVQVSEQAAAGQLPDVTLENGRLSVSPLTSQVPEDVESWSDRLYDLLPQDSSDGSSDGGRLLDAFQPVVHPPV